MEQMERPRLGPSQGTFTQGDMKDQVIFSCKGAVKIFDPEWKTWKDMPGLSDLIFLASSSVRLIAIQEKATQPFLQIVLGQNIDYQPDNNNRHWHIVRVISSNDEKVYGFEIRSLNDANFFSIHLCRSIEASHGFLPRDFQRNQEQIRTTNQVANRVTNNHAQISDFRGKRMPENYNQNMSPEIHRDYVMQSKESNNFHSLQNASRRKHSANQHTNEGFAYTDPKRSLEFPNQQSLFVPMEDMQEVVEDLDNSMNQNLQKPGPGRVSKLEIWSDMLAEAIEAGNEESAKEIAAKLAKQKAKLTIQVLCNDDRDKQASDSTINITVSVEDKQTTKPILFKLDVHPLCTIGKLKLMVFERYEFPIKVQRWIVGKSLPSDGRTLEQLDVKTSGTTIFLYLVSAKAAGLPEKGSQDRADLSPGFEGIQDVPSNDDRHRRPAPPPPPHNPHFNKMQSVPALNQTMSPFNRQAVQSQSMFARNPELPRTSSLGFGSEGDFCQETFEEFYFDPPATVSSAPPPVPARVPRRKEGWVCERCTFINTPTRPGCEICGDDRPKGYKPPANLRLDAREQERLRMEAESEQLVIKLENEEKETQSLAAMLNYQETMQTAHLCLIPNPEEFECLICMDPVAFGDGVMLRDCLHSFCRPCLVEHIKACVDPDVRCPFNDGTVPCEEEITAQEIVALLPEVDYLKFLEKSVNMAENRAADSFHCKTPNCKGWCIYEDEVNVYDCNICLKRNCLTCKAIHEKMSCKEYQDDIRRRSQNDEAAQKTQKMLDDMVRKGNAMNCPQCKVILQKKDGCDWIRCSMCRTEICWVTRGRRWGPQGNGDTTGGCNCRVNGKPCHPNCGNCH